MRLFVAIELSERVRKALGEAQSRLRSRCEGVRWVRPELLHVTLKFLGDVPDGDVDGVSAGVELAAESSVAFSMEAGEYGCFPPHGGVRVVWAGLSDTTGSLTRCAEAVEAQMIDLGFEPERRAFSPHITLGRVRDDRSNGRTRSVVEAYVRDPVEQPVDSVTLMSSILSPSGPSYTPVCTANLGRRGPTENER